MSTFGRLVPLVLALALLAAGFLIMLAVSSSRNGGHFGYTLDDTYIHMATARNFAEHGVWGVTREHFTSCSSSLLWTILLAIVYAAGGPSETAPLILNLVFASALLVQLHAIFVRHEVRPLIRAAALLAVVSLTPLVPLIFCGLEHPMQMVLAIACIDLAAQVISRRAVPDGGQLTRPEKTLLLVGPLTVLARFESLFLVFVVCLLLLARRRIRYALAFGGIALVPLVVYGLVSVAKGWYFLPNSVLVKASTPELSLASVVWFLLGYGPWGATGVRAIWEQKHLLVLIASALAAWFVRLRRKRDPWDGACVLLALFIATCFLHMQFARTGHFYRYEAYLVAAGIFVLTLAVHDRVPDAVPLRLLAVLLAGLLLVPLVERAVKAHRETAVAIGNIHQQQYQMGRFLAACYQGRGVVANDIGAITWLADFRLLDIAALASVEVADARRRHAISAEFLEQLASDQRMDIGVVYENWCPWNRLPPNWIRVGEWTIPDNVICAESTVVFFAVDQAEAEPLARHLKEFAKSLPAAVTWKVF